MSNFGAWSVKGIDDRARAAAKAQARQKGVTLGDYINELLLQGGPTSDARQDEAQKGEPGQAQSMSAQTMTESPFSSVSSPQTVNPIDHLARRIEAAEARSTLAITGIDQSVVGLLARIESTENNTSAMAAEVEGMIDELCETHEALQDKVRELETDETAQKNLHSLQTLEQALARLASHVHDENKLVEEESAAIKARVEAGFEEVSGRVEHMEGRIETRLSEATERVQKVVEEAELRAEGTSRHLSERFTDVEASVATRLARVDDIASRMGRFETGFSQRVEALESRFAQTGQDRAKLEERLLRIETDAAGTTERFEQTQQDRLRQDEQFGARISRIEDDVVGAVDALEKGLETSQHASDEIAVRLGSIEQDVTGAISSMEETMSRIQDRLNLAETTTDTALKALEETFTSLDQRIETALSQSSPARAEELQRVLEQKFEHLASDLRASVETSRRKMASEIEKAAQWINPELTARLEARVDTLQEQFAEGHGRTSKLFQAMGDQVNTLATGLNHRLEELEERGDDDLIGQVTEKLHEVASSFDRRISDSEKRSAAAIEQVGQQVATAIQRVKKHQGTQQTELLAAIKKNKSDQETRLSQALSNISDRLEKMQASTAASVSPVQKAIISLASRLEAVEDFTTPPHVDRPSASLPRMPKLSAAKSERLEDAFEPAEEDEPAHQDSEQDFHAEDEFYDDAEEFSEAENYSDESFEEDDEAFEPFSAQDEDQDEDQDDIHSFLVSEDEHDPFEGLDEWEEEGSDLQVAEDDETTIGRSSRRSDADVYLNRARQAAMVGSEDQTTRKSSLSSLADINLPGNLLGRGKKKKDSVKVPTVAAASILAIGVASMSGYIFLRGKQPDENRPLITKTDFMNGSSGTMMSLSVTPPPTAERLPAEANTFDSLEETLFEPVIPSQTERLAEARPVAATAPKTSLALIPEMRSLKQIADSGDPIAEFLFAEDYLSRQDYAQGLNYLRRAAEAGLPIAQYRLAKLYELGNGVEQDLNASFSWTERAAQGGNIKAMHDLAVFYVEGASTTQSYNAAVEWFRKAAGHGVVDSQYNLGVMFENGLGVTASPADALLWYAIAEASGDSSANENVQFFKANLPNQIVEDVMRQVTSWKPLGAPAVANGEFGQLAWEAGTTVQIQAVQAALNAFGYKAGSVDGMAGPGTRRAVQSFQKDAGLVANGQISPETISALNARITNAG